MDELSRALALHLGRPDAAWPQSRADAVVRAHGRDMSDRVDALLAEIGSIAIDWTGHTLNSATGYAEAEMKRRHPDLPDDVIANLGWAFSYWNK
jgi:hypothetical protein